MYVADRTNNRLQVFKIDGMFVKEVFNARNTLQAEGSVHAFAVSPDKEQKFLFFHAHSFAIDSKGNLFIGEVNNGGRYYKYAFKGMGAAPPAAR